MRELILIGASVRAAAWSARRAGFTPWCADLFGDVDLRQVAQMRTIAVDDYPHGFAEIMKAAPSVPWMYTGALENRPKLVDQLAKQRALWGAEADVLRRVRDPFEVSRV